MKSPLLLLTLLISPLAPAQEAETAAPPLTAAVLDFKDGSPELDGTGTSVSTLLQALLGGATDAILVERAELNEILGEQELTLSDTVTPGQAARVGQLTGAEAIISGRVFPVENQIYIVAKVISTSTGRVFGATGKYPSGGDLDTALEGITDKIAGILSEKSSDLRGGKSLEDTIRQSITAKTKDQAPKKAHIAIEEQIIRNQVIDPAVQTEVQRTLQQIGWTIVENPADADILVTGEAIAEAGARRGNLWFTRARLEFTVKANDEKILKIDRLTTGHVDLAESISGKGALQKAGLIATELVIDAALAPAE